MKNKCLSLIAIVTCSIIGSFILSISGVKVHATETLKTYQVESGEATVSESAISSKELLEGFMHKQAGSGFTFNVKNSNRRTSLSSVNGYIYDQIKTRVISIANGQEASGSITVTVPIKTLMGTAWKDKYTATDLGVTAVIGADGLPTREATDAILKLKGCNVDTVLYAICMDCPYEMYWFGNRYEHSANTFMYSPSGGYITLQETDTITINLVVSKDYSASGNEGTTDVSTAKCQAVKSAADYANQIIKDNAAKSDYEKLKAYKDIICELNTYNSAAMQNDMPYGNPWQIVYVFDKNPSTNVVCEGYAKAFKYLCDGSSFQSNQIECYLITGQMSGGTGAGGHMWNHMRMDDGKIYLVDATNCDSGTIGYPDKLFLTGGEDSNGDTWLEANNEYVYYAFDANTKAVYSAAELTWSKKDYSVKSETDTTQDQVSEETTAPVNGMAKSGSIEYKTFASGKATIVSNSNKKAKSINVADDIALNGVVYEIAEIKSGVYKNFKKLSKATLGRNIEKIGANAFNGCSKLGKISINANNLKSVGKNAFKGVKKNAKVTVYAKDKKTYNKAVKMLKKAGLKKAKFIYKEK